MTFRSLLRSSSVLYFVRSHEFYDRPKKWATLIFRDIYTMSTKKYAPWCLIITLANVERFSTLFYQLIRKKNSLCIHVYHSDFHRSCNVLLYATFWKSNIQKCWTLLHHSDLSPWLSSHRLRSFYAILHMFYTYLSKIISAVFLWQVR